MTKSVKQDFGSQVAKIVPAILREVTRSHETVLTKGDLTFSHIVLLDLLREGGPCKMSKVAETLNLSLGAATNVIDKMTKSGLVKRERSKKDRRVVRVTLLQKGARLAGQVNKARRDLSNEMYSVLTKNEKKEYLRMLEKVYNNLEK